MPLLKICGLQRTEDAVACAEFGVDVIGCIVNYPEAVPWRIQPHCNRRPVERNSRAGRAVAARYDPAAL